MSVNNGFPPCSTCGKYTDVLTRGECDLCKTKAIFAAVSSLAWGIPVVYVPSSWIQDWSSPMAIITDEKWLKAELSRAIQEENYERAAELRDKLAAK
jgi:hypothetical protein